MKPREFNPRKTLIMAAVLIGLFVYMYTRDVTSYRHAVMQGETMGTSYTVKIAEANLSDTAYRRLYRSIGDELTEINRQMSTWLPDSEISRFNHWASTNAFPVSPGFSTVVRSALETCAATGGAFDPTVAPLINLWGFGEKGRRQDPPSEEDLAKARSRIGYAHLQVEDGPALRKDLPELEINLSAIAKGYGVDQLSGILQQGGLTNHYVEIGGEVRVMGVNTNGTPWRIGIERPDPDILPAREMYAGKILYLTGMAVATSGDYRNFIKNASGGREGHIIDPRTGHPARHRLVSVSVLAPTCMLADAYATGLYVMGTEAGLAWVEQQNGVEALFIYQDESGKFVDRASSGFERFLSPRL